jgi:hypothetical protein
MKKKLTQALGVSMLFLLLFILPVMAAESSGVRKLSANIPLNSYIYTDLAKLEGLGYLKEMPNGTKPYTRMQVARWVKGIHEQVNAEQPVPAYVQALLDRLETEFDPELAALGGKSDGQSSIVLREMTVAGSYYHGDSLSQLPKTKSVYQPLHINNNGVKLEDGANGLVSGVLEGNMGNNLLVSLTPRFDLNEDDTTVSLESGYLKTHFRNLQIQLGRDALWWGPGERGNLSLTNNARPFTSIYLSNLEPIRPDGIFKLLRQVDIDAFYADLEEKRSNVNSPGFFGVRIATTPGNNLTIAGTLNAIAGGVGHELHFSDIGDFITGKNADTAPIDKWDTIAGFDFRWRIPRLNGLQLYGELYGEDQAGKIIPFPSKNTYLVGFVLPRLTSDGRWDLQCETAKTTSVWYEHSLYWDGYTYHDKIIGDAMGNNAMRYYLKLSRYLADGSRLALNLEQLTMRREMAYPQKVNSLWLSYNVNLQTDLTFNATVGFAAVDHLNYQAGQSGHNYLGSIGITKRFN